MTQPLRLRVATYNVHGFRSGVAAVDTVVGALEADVLLVQESGPRRTLARFAAASGLSVAADPRSPLRRRVKNAVLVRPPLAIEEHRLRRFRGSSVRYPRGCLVASVRSPAGVRCWMVSVHLGLDGGERGRHVRELLGIVDELERSAPVVLGGDLNATPEARSVAAIGARLADVSAGADPAPTFPAPDPSARIDHLFASAGVRVATTWTGADGAARASDHLPVVADLELSRPET